MEVGDDRIKGGKTRVAIPKICSARVWPQLTPRVALGPYIAKT